MYDRHFGNHDDPIDEFFYHICLCLPKNNDNNDIINQNIGINQNDS